MSIMRKIPRGDLRFALSLALVTLLAPVATDMYLASMPEIARQLEVSYARVQLTLTAFLLAQGAGQIFFGPLIDRFGRRGPLMAGIIVFMASSAWAASAVSFDILLISRFVQGLAGALLLVTGFSSVRDIADGPAAAKLFAVLLTIEGLAPIFAPIAGGYINSAFGWRAVLLASALMGAAGLLNSFFSLPESLPREKRLPLNPASIAATYRRIISDKSFILPTFGLSAVFFYLFAYIGGGSYLYQDIYGLSSDSFGLVFGFSGSAVMAGAVTNSRLVRSRDVSQVAIGGIIIIIAGTAISLAASLLGGFYGLVAGFVVALFGLGMAEPALVAMVMSSQKSALGFTAALMGAMHLMLSSLSTPVSGFLLPISKDWWLVFLLVSAFGALLIALAARRVYECPEDAAAAEIEGRVAQSLDLTCEGN